MFIGTDDWIALGGARAMTGRQGGDEWNEHQKARLDCFRQSLRNDGQAIRAYRGVMNGMIVKRHDWIALGEARAMTGSRGDVRVVRSSLRADRRGNPD